ncbi:GMC oxidoreductase [Bradyrhizobium yuanmingense]|uniref:GMC oxidoreductase n=1 Tax=Bradyrhizobium yuanmingense TaxID=108015 RepID=UPI001CD34C7B|nr:GMC family oxidoreductase [Bradyrhizobium yuanmingense]
MIISSEDIDVSSLTPDVTIVGGGAVGLIAAVYLASRKVKVLVLEAGPLQVDPDSQLVFESARSSGRRHLGIYQGRFRALGGTTNFWGGQLVRFDRLVFSPRDWVSGDAWPIGYDQIEQFYKICESLLDVPPELTDDQKLLQLSRTPNVHLDANLTYFFSRWLTEKNFRFRFSHLLKSDPNVTVVTGAPVTMLKFDGSRRSVTSVIVSGPRGPTQVSSRFVVLANGTIEMVRLLQHPTVGEEEAPWSQNPWLGRGFMDHLEGTVAKITPVDRKLFHQLFDNVFLKGMKLQPRLKLSEELQRKERLLGAAFHVKFDSQMEEHVQNAKIFVSGLLKGRFSNPKRIIPELWSAARVGVPMSWHYIKHQRILSPAGGDIQLRIMLEQTPVLSSTLNLTRERDQHGMYLPELCWRVSSETEIRTIQKAVGVVKGYFESRGIAKVDPSKEISGRSPDLLDSFVDTYHHMGGVRMASSEKDGVVDPTARVFGSQNLYVMGAATFPVSGFANPTFTAMAIALRTAEVIRERVVAQ